MTSKPQYEGHSRTELVELEDEEKYLLFSKAEIVRVLRDLARKPDIITAYFNEGKQYLLTAVIGVLPDRDMVVLDYGPQESVNDSALKANRIVCITRHEHVMVKFVLSGLQRAKYKGDRVIAAPLPESVYRPQRREFFRVQLPQYNPILMRLPTDGGGWLELPVLDLSYGGAGLVDSNDALTAESGTVLRGCRVELPSFGTLELDLEIRNRIPQKDGRGNPITRVGCRFVGLSMDSNATIARFINRMQLEQKERERR